MIVYLFWFFASFIVFYSTLKSEKHTQTTAMTLFLFAMGVFVGLGDMLGGYDRYIYAELFDKMANSTLLGGNPWSTTSFAFYGSEFGYGSLCAMITFLTSNRYVFIFLVTILIYVLLIISLRQYVENAPFAVIIFMGLFFFFTFTYLRQVLGCVIAWLSIKYVIQRDFKKFLLIWFIAFSFHNSAILFLPVYFIPIKKFSQSEVITLMVVALLIGLSPLPQALFSSYGEINAERMTASYELDTGFRWAYLLESSFFLFVILTCYHNISNEIKDVVMLNVALIFCAVLLVFVRSENGGRLGWFFIIGIMCTLSNLCIQDNKLLKQGVLIITMCFFLFYRLTVLWEFNMCPYKTFLTPGHTASEWIYQKYEYDRNYDVDKFYR